MVALPASVPGLRMRQGELDHGPNTDQRRHNHGGRSCRHHRVASIKPGGCLGQAHDGHDNACRPGRRAFYARWPANNGHQKGGAAAMQEMPALENFREKRQISPIYEGGHKSR